MGICEQERTLHILCQHFTDFTPDSVRLQLATWIPRHFVWIKSVANDFLKKTKMDIMEYLDALICPSFIYDELAFFIFARFTAVHINMITTKHIWSTKRIQKIHLPEITLAFFGKSKFSDTRERLLLSPNYIIPENAFKADLSEVQSQKVFPQEDGVTDEALKKEIDNVGMIDYVSQHEVVLGSIHLKTEPIANEGLSSDCDHYVPHLNDTVQDTPQQYLPNSASEGLLPDKDQTSSLHADVTHQAQEHDLLNSASETSEGLLPDKDQTSSLHADVTHQAQEHDLLNSASETSEGLLPDKDQTSSLHADVTHQAQEHDLLNSVSETSEGLLPDKDQTSNISSSQEMLTKCFVSLQQLTMLDLEPISLCKCSVNLEPLSVRDMQQSSLHKCSVNLEPLSVRDVQQSSLHKCSVNLEPLNVKDMQQSSLCKCYVNLESLSVKDVQQSSLRKCCVNLEPLSAKDVQQSSLCK